MTDDVPLTTVARAFEILEFVRDRDGTSVGTVADTVGVPQSTAHDYLTTLARLGYLTNEQGEYEVSLRFLEYGSYVRTELTFEDDVNPVLESLAAVTDETVWYIVEERGEAVYVAEAVGSDALQPYAAIGTRSPLHSIAGGKAVLAHLADEHVDQIVETRGLERQTSRTITTRDALDEMRTRVREQGYALNRGENIDGWRAVSSPVVVDEDLYGAIAVAGPENRLRGAYFEEKLPERTVDAATELQVRLRSSISS